MEQIAGSSDQKGGRTIGFVTAKQLWEIEGMIEIIPELQLNRRCMSKRGHPPTEGAAFCCAEFSDSYGRLSCEPTLQRSTLLSSAAVTPAGLSIRNQSEARSARIQRRKELVEKLRPQRPVPVWLRPLLSSVAACAQATTTASPRLLFSAIVVSFGEVDQALTSLLVRL